jgi:hypothetical protein
MSRLPKLKIHSLSIPENKDEICDLEEARHRLDYGPKNIVLVEGQMVDSHEKLVQLASQEGYRDREFLEVVMLPFIAGG